MSSSTNIAATAFLCSQRFPASAVLKCYDWAVAQREAGQCVMLGAHSKLERDVYALLLKGTQPVVLVLARGMRKEWSAAEREAMASGRLRVLSPFGDEVRRASAKTAAVRNAWMVERAEKVVVGYARPGGAVDALVKGLEGKGVVWL